MTEQTPNRDPKHLSELLVPDILFPVRASGRRSGKNHILLESMSATPGAVTMGPERDIKQLHEFAENIGITNLRYIAPTEENSWAQLESVEFEDSKKGNK